MCEACSQAAPTAQAMRCRGNPGAPRLLVALFLSASLLCLAASGAEALEADLGPRLLEARRAWEKGDALGAQAAQAARRGGDPIPLLDQQEAAYETAEVAYRELVKLDAEHPHALADFGRFLIARKQFGEARHRLESAVRSPRAEKALAAAERAEALRALGGALERGGHWARAIGAYREALELQPGDARARLSLAIALCAWDDPADALEALQPWAGAPDGWQALPASQRALALYTYAYAEEQDGRPEQALAGYKRARESSQEAGEADLCGVAEQARLAAGRLGVLLRSLQPEGKRAAYERAATLCREGARKKAAALRDKDAFALARHDLWQAQEPAQQAQARAQEPLKSLYQAMRCFQDALLAEPKYGRAHRELGLCCLALVEPKAALAHLEAAAAYDPCSPLVLALLGESQLAAGGWEKALETFRRLLSLEPEYGPANLGFARAALRLHRSPNELDLARDALDRARALGADPRAVVKVREELDEAAARLKRGESLGAAVGPPRPPGAGPAAPEPVPIWRGSVLDW